MLELLYSIGLAMTASYQLHLAVAISGLSIVMTIGLVLLAVKVWRKQFRIGKWQILAPVILLSAIAMARSPNIGTGLIALAMPLAYLVGTNIGQVDHRVTAAVVIIGSLSVAVWQLAGLQPAYAGKNGGIFGNPNIAVGGLVMSAVMCNARWQYIVVAIALVGVCLTGSEEGLIAVAVVGLTVLARRDWSSRIAAPAVLTVALLAVAVASGIWQTTPARVQTAASAMVNGSAEQMDTAFNGRWQQWQYAVSDIEPLGHGYRPLTLLNTSIHNVPLRVLHELGPMAMALWLYVVAWGLFRSKMKYPFAAILGLSLFDNYMWTVMMPWCFTAVGIAAVAEQPDYIFRKDAKALDPVMDRYHHIVSVMRRKEVHNDMEVERPQGGNEHHVRQQSQGAHREASRAIAQGWVESEGLSGERR